MMLIRPIAQEDFPALYRIAEASGTGFTSLQANHGSLQRRIDHSVASFALKEIPEPGNEGYLFVLEDTESGEVVGTTGLEAAVGLDDAFYNYHISTLVHSSRELGVYNRVQTLTLSNDYTGASELCTLFLMPHARHSRNGRLLSKCRFLFLAQFAERFSETIFAEMRGVSDAEGQSPFWQALGERFFSMDFTKADYLSGVGNKVFIAELMPKYPIYANLLPQEARDVIGQVHEYTKPALKLLEQEGFRCKGYIDIFDGGPAVECELPQIKSVRESQLRQVEIGRVAPEQPMCLLSNTELAGFRCVQQPATLSGDGTSVVITPDVAEALKVNAGEPIRVLAFAEKAVK